MCESCPNEPNDWRRQPLYIKSDVSRSWLGNIIVYLKGLWCPLSPVCVDILICFPVITCNQQNNRLKWWISNFEVQSLRIWTSDVVYALIMEMKNRFHWADCVVFIIMLIASLGIGLWHAWKGTRKKTTEEYLMGGRELQVDYQNGNTSTFVKYIICYKFTLLLGRLCARSELTKESLPVIKPLSRCYTRRWFGGIFAASIMYIWSWYVTWAAVSFKLPIFLYQI